MTLFCMQGSTVRGISQWSLKREYLFECTEMHHHTVK